jgi:hypothetical protein
MSCKDSRALTSASGPLLRDGRGMKALFRQRTGGIFVPVPISVGRRAALTRRSRHKAGSRLLLRRSRRIRFRLEQAPLLDDAASHLGEPQIALARGHLEPAEGVLLGELEG